MGCSVPWYFSRIVLAACFIVWALLLNSPAGLMHSSIWLSSAFARASGVISKCFERFSKALAVFLSAVFCEMIVTMKVSKGSRFDLTQLGKAKVCRSICKTFAARFSVTLPLRLLKMI